MLQLLLNKLVVNTIPGIEEHQHRAQREEVDYGIPSRASSPSYNWRKLVTGAVTEDVYGVPKLAENLRKKVQEFPVS